MSSKPYPHVLIVGGGLGGLALAQALRKQGVSFEVFERDSDESIRPQGWAIGLHTTLTDLTNAMPDDLPPISVTNHLLPLELPTQVMFYNSEKPDVRLGVTDDKRGNILRANRPKLRDWLRTHLPVQYGKRAVKFDEGPENVTVYFADGTSARGDIVVGADGTSSNIRDHLLAKQGKEVVANTLPLSTIVGELTLTGQDFVNQLELAHSCYAVSTPEESAYLFVGLNEVSPDGKTGYYYWQLVTPDETAVDEENFWTRTATKERLLEFVKENTSFLPPGPMADIIEKTPLEGVWNKQLSYHQLGLKREDVPSGKVVLLGDAAHTMTPFRGEGGICAFMDSLDLARAITQIAETQAKGLDLEKIVTEYNDIMMTRGLTAIQLSREAVRLVKTSSKNKQDESPSAPRIIWGHEAVPEPRRKIAI